MAKATYNPQDLWDEILTSHEIKCSKCKTIQTVNMVDEDSACAIFFASGWRKTPTNLYCHKCAIKKLKK